MFLENRAVWFSFAFVLGLYLNPFVSQADEVMEEEESIVEEWPVAEEKEDPVDELADEEAPLPELWFPVGEELVYRILWGRIGVGRSVATTEWVEEDGRTLLAIRLRTRTNRVLSRLYPVDDHIESLIDPHTFLPVRFTVNFSQGRYRKHEITEFDHEAGVAHWRSLIRDREDTFELEDDTRCLVSFSYYLRQHPFEEGKRQHFRVMADDKIYDLWLESRGLDRIRLRHYGRVPSIELEPEAAFEGIFVRRGRMTLWVSDDERRIVTQMQAAVPVASVRLVLHRVRGPGNDDWTIDVDDDDDDDEDYS